MHSAVHHIAVFLSYLGTAAAQRRPNPNINIEDLHLIPGYKKAHGIIMGLTFTVMFPIGVFGIRYMRSKGQRSIWLHAGWQLISWALMIAGFSIGVRMANILDMLHHTTHTILGLVVVSLLLVQPFIGLVHHFRFRKTQEPGAWTLVHVWYGRALMLLGIINGGLGLQLASNTTGGEIAYGVVGGISGVGILLLVISMKTEKKVLSRMFSKEQMRERVV